MMCSIPQMIGKGRKMGVGQLVGASILQYVLTSVLAHQETVSKSVKLSLLVSRSSIIDLAHSFLGGFLLDGRIPDTVHSA